MKALAIDCASSKMVVTAKNEDNIATLILEIGPKQSKELLPAIDFVLNKVELQAKDLDYTTLCEGPGTFTGLRLAFSALKAIELSFDIPIYAVSTLECYAFPFKSFYGKIISTIDAKKNQFFAAIYSKDEVIMNGEDSTLEKVCSFLKNDEQILCVGPDSKEFSELLKNKLSNENIIYFENQENSGKTLFTLAEKMIEQKKEPLKDFAGPQYLRKSEAELMLEEKLKSNN